MNSPITIPIPKRIAKLPTDERGYPIPFFVDYTDDGKPEFRAFDPLKLKKCIFDRVCWVCGEKLGRFMAFVIGPMCMINRVSADAPSHLDCAQFSAIACPFLSNPKQKRKESKDQDSVMSPPGGEMIKRNPGIAMVWVTKGYEIWKTKTGPIFRIGDPTDVLFYREGRTATRAEIVESIESGYPLLYDEAVKQDEENPKIKAVNSLMEAKAVAYKLLTKIYGEPTVIVD